VCEREKTVMVKPKEPKDGSLGDAVDTAASE
jgi:hypothetical protein